MRHGKKFNHLGRTASHRKAMLSNMACSLIEHKRINTTLAKAKALRVYVEPLLTKSKSDSTHSRRTVFSYLKNKYATAELFREVAPKIMDRSGGYTRIIKLGKRLGDNAETAMIELVDFNEMYQSTEVKKKKTRRRGGGAGKAKATVDSKEEIVETSDEVAEVEVTNETKPETPEKVVEATTETKETVESEKTGEPEASSEEKTEGDDSKEEEEKAD